MLVLDIIAALLLPPLAVYLRLGIGPAFWIAVLVTVLFWAPGFLFALVVVLKPDLLPTQWTARRA